MIIYLIVGLTKKTLYKMSQYFPKPYEPSGGEINIKVNLPNYATKTDSKKQQELIRQTLIWYQNQTWLS